MKRICHTSSTPHLPKVWKLLSLRPGPHIDAAKNGHDAAELVQIRLTGKDGAQTCAVPAHSACVSDFMLMLERSGSAKYMELQIPVERGVAVRATSR
jgi:hypothetical protein